MYIYIYVSHIYRVRHRVMFVALKNPCIHIHIMPVRCTPRNPNVNQVNCWNQISSTSTSPYDDPQLYMEVSQVMGVPPNHPSPMPSYWNLWWRLKIPRWNPRISHIWMDIRCFHLPSYCTLSLGLQPSKQRRRRRRTLVLPPQDFRLRCGRTCFEDRHGGMRRSKSYTWDMRIHIMGIFYGM